MIFAWRITKTRYAHPSAAAFDGEGARRRGGRWHRPGQRVAYASSSLALAAMEYFVNLAPEDAPADLVSVEVRIPDDLHVQQVAVTDLPQDWQSYPAVEALQGFGADWLNTGATVALLVPSVVIPGTSNVLINPTHPDFRKLVFQPATGFRFDPRMWKQ